jgi:hypothetical protein
MVTSGFFFPPKYGNFAAFFPKQNPLYPVLCAKFCHPKKLTAFFQAFVIRG